MQQPENGDDQNLMDEVHDDQAPSRRVYDLQTLRAIGKKVFLQRKPCPEEISRHYSGIDIRRHSVVQRISSSRVKHETSPAATRQSGESTWFDSRANHARMVANGSDADKDARYRRENRRDSTSQFRRNTKDDPWDMPTSAGTESSFQFGDSGDVLERGRAEFLSQSRATATASQKTVAENEDDVSEISDDVYAHQEATSRNERRSSGSDSSSYPPAARVKPSALFQHLAFASSDASIDDIIGQGIEDASRAPTTSATPTPRFLIDVMSQGYYGDDDKLGREEVEALLDRSGTLPNAKDQLIVHSCPPPQQASVPIEEGNLGSNSSTSAVNAAGSVMDLLKNARIGGAPSSRLSKWVRSSDFTNSVDEGDKQATDPEVMNFSFDLSLADLIGEASGGDENCSRVLETLAHARAESNNAGAGIQGTKPADTVISATIDQPSSTGKPILFASNTQHKQAPQQVHDPVTTSLPPRGRGQRISLQTLFSSVQAASSLSSPGAVQGPISFTGANSTIGDYTASAASTLTIERIARASAQTGDLPNTHGRSSSDSQDVPLPAGAVASMYPYVACRPERNVSGADDLLQKLGLAEQSDSSSFQLIEQGETNTQSWSYLDAPVYGSPGVATNYTSLVTAGASYGTSQSQASHFTFHDTSEPHKLDKRKKKPLVSAASRFAIHSKVEEAAEPTLTHQQMHIPTYARAPSQLMPNHHVHVTEAHSYPTPPGRKPPAATGYAANPQVHPLSYQDAYSHPDHFRGHLSERSVSEVIPWAYSAQASTLVTPTGRVAPGFEYTAQNGALTRPPRVNSYAQHYSHTPREPYHQIYQQRNGHGGYPRAVVASAPNIVYPPQQVHQQVAVQHIGVEQLFQAARTHVQPPPGHGYSYETLPPGMRFAERPPAI